MDERKRPFLGVSVCLSGAAGVPPFRRRKAPSPGLWSLAGGGVGEGQGGGGALETVGLAEIEQREKEGGTTAGLSGVVARCLDLDRFGLDLGGG